MFEEFIGPKKRESIDSLLLSPIKKKIIIRNGILMWRVNTLELI